MPDTPIELIPDPAGDDMLSPTELILLSLEHRLGRTATALEAAAKATASRAANAEELTNQVSRLADAFEAMAGYIGCVMQSVEGADGVSRCYVRTSDHPSQAFVLSAVDERGIA